MKRNCLVLIFLFMLLLTAGAFAQAFSGDVTIKVNGGLLPASPAPQIYIGEDNVIEMWLTNNKPIKGMSLALGMTLNGVGSGGGVAFQLVPGYGGIPCDTLDQDGGGPYPVTKYVLEHGTFLNTFGVCGNNFNSLMGPDSVMVGGASSTTIPVHNTSEYAYSFKIHIPATTAPGTFCVRPIFLPPAGPWKMVAASGSCFPSFQGVTVNYPGPSPVPDAPPVCFAVDIKPCPAVSWSSTPVLPVSHSHGSNYTFPFVATTDAPYFITGYTTTVGSIPGGVLTVTHPAGCGTTDVTVGAANDCQATASFPFTINWTNANPAITNCPAATLSTGLGSTLTYPFTYTDADGDIPTWAVNVIPGAAISSTGVFTFTPAATGLYTFTVTATDVCQGEATCTFSINVTSFNIVQIAKTGENPDFVYQGTYTTVPVSLSGSALNLAGYNLLIHYDASALSFVSATIGPNLGPCPGGSGWEYFTYRFGDNGNCGGACPSGLLRLVALAETNNGPNHPGCHGAADPYNIYGVIANLKFYVTNDRTFDCMYTEVGFAWIDCSDNAFSDITGDTLYIAAAKAVHTFEWNKLDLNAYLMDCEPYPNMTGIVYGGFCPGECLNQSPIPNKPNPLEKIYFMNGGVDIACADSIDARGDINLNGIRNEIADAVLFTNFFLKGINAFDSNPQRRQGMVAATDVNADGKVLTVGDLVYLLRIIVGDALPYTKLSPFASAATVNFAGGSVSTESASEIGAVYATFAINGDYNVVSNTNMKVETGEVNGELKVLVYSGLNSTNRIAIGTNELFTVSGNVELKSVDVADYYGNMLNVRVSKVSLPTSFALSQNVPNPFNPTTKLGFALPNQTEWTLSIYNVAGQLVKNFSGNNIGNVSVEWDASMAPSGVYFYKLNAGSYSDTKKMVLMK